METLQQQIPGQEKLFEAAQLEVDYLYALWDEDYKKCLELAQSIASILSGDDLQGLRGFWYYLAASGAELAFQKFENQVFVTKAIDLYERASSCLPALDWLRVLATCLTQDNEQTAIEENAFLDANIERIELLFETNSFTSPQRFEHAAKEILEGLDSSESDQFEEAHRRLGEMLGFEAGNSNGQATPDPWWISTENLCIVFEDKSDSKPEHAVSVKYACQAASHHEWIRDNVELNPNTEIYTVMITTQSKVHKDVPTFAAQVGWWHIEEFKDWAHEVISLLRELRSTFTGAGQSEWRTILRKKLLRNSLDPKSIVAKATQKLLRDLDVE